MNQSKLLSEPTRGYFYVAYVKHLDSTNTMVKFGMTMRPIICRFKEHHTYAYTFMLLIKIEGSREQIFDCETQCLVDTFEFAVIRDDIYNECRMGRTASEFFEICKKSIGKILPKEKWQEVDFEKEKLILPDTSDDTTDPEFHKIAKSRDNFAKRFAELQAANFLELKREINFKSKNCEIPLGVKVEDLTEDLTEDLAEGGEEEKYESDEELNVEPDVARGNGGSLEIKTPQPHQPEIIQNCVNYFKTNDKGILQLPCGSGKTMISLWAAEESGAKSILIGVPSVALCHQWKKNIKSQYPTRPIFIVAEGASIEDFKIFISKNYEKYFVIVCYASSFKLAQYFNSKTVPVEVLRTNSPERAWVDQSERPELRPNFQFDFAIFDECHHLTCLDYKTAIQTRGKFVNILAVPARKTLSLTATLKEFEEDRNCRPAIKGPAEGPAKNQTEGPEEKIEAEPDDLDEVPIKISNASLKWFGKIIDRRSLLWAIQNKIVCEYLLQTIFIQNLDEVLARFQTLKIETDLDRRLFLSAFVALKSVEAGFSKHILIYANTIEHADKIISYVDGLLSERYFNLSPSNIVRMNYHSNLSREIRKNFLGSFEKSPIGIMALVYSLAEGFDMPLIDAVVFSETMSSNIRIVQSALRCIRKYGLDPNKIAKIILPIMLASPDDRESGEFLNVSGSQVKISAADLQKIKNVVVQMGVEDSMIGQRIKVSSLIEDVKKVAIEVKLTTGTADESQKSVAIGQFDPELSKNIALRTIPRVALSYRRTQKIVADKKLQTKKEYDAACLSDSRLPLDPARTFGEPFDWIVFLGLRENFGKVYYCLAECKKRIAEIIAKNPKLEELRMSLKLDELIKCVCFIDSSEKGPTEKCFPHSEYWRDYYYIDLKLLLNIQNKKQIIPI